MLLCRTAPAGVNGGDRTMHGIHHQQGDAIGGLDRNEHPWRVLQKRVAVAQTPGPATAGNYDIRVNLMQRGEVAATAETVRPACTETVHQPVESLERSNPVNILRVLVEHTS